MPAAKRTDGGDKWIAEGPDKERRARFLRNLDFNFPGITVSISDFRFPTFEALLDRLNFLLSSLVTLPSEVRTIVGIDGAAVNEIAQIIDGDICVCCCDGEYYQDIGYNIKLSAMFHLGKRLQALILEENEIPVQVLSSVTYVKKAPSNDIFKKITFGPAKMLMKPFNVEEEIYSTFYTKVYRVRNMSIQKQYVLKVINLDKSPYNVGIFRNEANLMRTLRGCSITLGLAFVIESPKYYYLMTESMDIDLCDLSERLGRFPESKMKKVVRDLSEGLHYMHVRKIIHRDFKLPNVLARIDATDNILELKICDFGLSTVYGDRPLFYLCGTMHYMAPEMIKFAGYDLRIDCWALGVIIYTLVCAQFPFGNLMNNNADIFPLIRNDPVIIPTEVEIGFNLKNLIFKLLNKNPKQRLSSKELKVHPFVLNKY